MTVTMNRNDKELAVAINGRLDTLTSPVKPEHEGYVHLAGMVLLFGVMIFATYNDIARLITGG